MANIDLNKWENMLKMTKVLKENKYCKLINVVNFTL